MAYDGFELPFLLFIGIFTIKIYKNYVRHICTSLCVWNKWRRISWQFTLTLLKFVKIRHKQHDVKRILMCIFCTSQAWTLYRTSLWA